MYSEADLLPLSGLQHIIFCERQCALIHVEGAWRENVLTAEGRVLHERADSGADETRGDVRIVRSVPVRSLRLGVSGRVDVVELHRVREVEGGDAQARSFPGLSGAWRPVPVEYKRGEPKYGDCDRVQVCAQALCLEEMLGVLIPRGLLFYGSPRRRVDVTLDETLRATTVEAARQFHQLVESGRTPIVSRQPKCRQCSLLPVCLPAPRRSRRSAAAYVQSALREHHE